MRRIRPLGSTYTGLVTIGILGGVSLGLLSAIMFLFRPQAEPVVRFVVPAIASSLGSRRGLYRYNPETYLLWPSLAAFLSLLWVGLTLFAILRKPAEDKHLDAALKGRLSQAARGAPLEPE